MCQLFKDLLSNASRLEGLCYDANDEAQRLKFQNYSNIKSIFQNFTHQQVNLERKENLFNLNLTSFQLFRREFKTEQSSVNIDSHEHLGPYFYIIVVICFYSLSVVFLLIASVNFKYSIKKGFLTQCLDNVESNDLYEQQKEETKLTIDLFFHNSQKRLNKHDSILLMKKPCFNFEVKEEPEISKETKCYLETEL